MWTYTHPKRPDEPGQKFWSPSTKRSMFRLRSLPDEVLLHVLGHEGGSLHRTLTNNLDASWCSQVWVFFACAEEARVRGLITQQEYSGLFRQDAA